MKICDSSGVLFVLQKNDIIGYIRNSHFIGIQVLRSFGGELFPLYFRGKKKKELYKFLPGQLDEVDFRAKAESMAAEVGLLTISVDCKQLPEYINLTWACEVC